MDNEQLHSFQTIEDFLLLQSQFLQENFFVCFPGLKQPVIRFVLVTVYSLIVFISMKSHIDTNTYMNLEDKQIDKKLLTLLSMNLEQLFLIQIYLVEQLQSALEQKMNKVVRQTKESFL